MTEDDDFFFNKLVDLPARVVSLPRSVVSLPKSVVSRAVTVEVLAVSRGTPPTNVVLFGIEVLQLSSSYSPWASLSFSS